MLVSVWFFRDQVTLQLPFDSITHLHYQRVEPFHFLAKMTFTNDYSIVLSPFVVEYKSAKNEKGRKAVVKDAADAVMRSKELQEDGGEDLPKDLQTVCFFSIQFSSLYNIRLFQT